MSVELSAKAAAPQTALAESLETNVQMASLHCSRRKEILDQESSFKVLHNYNDTNMTRHFFFHLLECNNNDSELASMPLPPSKYINGP